MDQGQVSNQSGTSWYPVITANSYKVVVLIISLINDITHQYTNATQNTPHKARQHTIQNKFWRGSAISDCFFFLVM